MSGKREVVKTATALKELDRGEMVTLRRSGDDDSHTTVAEVTRMSPEHRRGSLVMGARSEIADLVEEASELILDFPYQDQVCFVHATVTDLVDTGERITLTVELKQSALLLEMRGSERHRVHGEIDLVGESGQKLLSETEPSAMNLSRGGMGATLPRRLVSEGQTLELSARFSPPTKTVRTLVKKELTVPRCKLEGEVEVRHVHTRPAHTGDSHSYAGFKFIEVRAEVDRAEGLIELEEFLDVIGRLDDLMKSVEAGGEIPYVEHGDEDDGDTGESGDRHEEPVSADGVDDPDAEADQTAEEETGSPAEKVSGEDAGDEQQRAQAGGNAESAGG